MCDVGPDDDTQLHSFLYSTCLQIQWLDLVMMCNIASFIAFAYKQ